jgi:hypothetical protein
LGVDSSSVFVDAYVAENYSALPAFEGTEEAKKEKKADARTSPAEVGMRCYVCSIES